MNINFFSDPKLKLRSIKKSHIIDLFIVLALSLIAVMLSLNLSSRAPNVFYEQYDIWYGADINRVYDNLFGSQLFNNDRSHIHPIFTALIGLFLTFLGFLNIDGFSAIYLLIAISGALVTILLYFTLRFNGLSILSCSLCVGMFLSSGSYIFWWSVLETFCFGAVTIAIVFLLLSTKVKSKWIWVLSSALTFGITITNWFSSILGVLLTFKRSKIKYILGLSLAIVAILYVSRMAYSSNIDKNPTDIGMEFYQEGSYVLFPRSTAEIPKYINKYFKRGIAFFVHSGVASNAIINNKSNKIKSSFIDYGVYGWTALSCWFILIFSGIRQNILNFKTNKLSKALILFVLFQLLMHVVYGDEPFLYSAHYIIPLIIMVSFAINETKYKRLYQTIALLFCICAMINNFQNYENALLLMTKIKL